MTLRKCFALETKRYLKSLPYIVFHAIALLLLCGAIAFCAIHYFGDTDSPAQSKIGLYSEDQNDSSYAMQIAQSYDATGTYFQFQSYLNQDVMMQDLSDGIIMAAMYFPSGSIDSILNGDNYHIGIYVGNQTGIAALLLQELSTAGASILTSAQASTYTLSDVYIQNNLRDELNDAYDQLDIINLRYALTTDQVFRTNNLSVSGTVSLSLFYIVVTVILFLGMSGLCFSNFMEPYPNTFRITTSLKTRVRLQISRYLMLLLSYIVLSIVALFVTSFCLTGIHFNASFIARLLLCALIFAIFHATLIYGLYRLFRGNSYAPLLYLTIILVMALLAGFIVPAAYMGSFLGNIMHYNPLYQLKEHLIGILQFGGAV